MQWFSKLIYPWHLIVLLLAMNYNARDTLQDLINQKKRLNDRRALIIFNDSMYFRHPEKKEAIRFALQNYAQIITLITQNG
jgi:hypothetical protein